MTSWIWCDRFSSAISAIQEAQSSTTGAATRSSLQIIQFQGDSYSNSSSVTRKVLSLEFEGKNQKQQEEEQLAIVDLALLPSSSSSSIECDNNTKNSNLSLLARFVRGVVAIIEIPSCLFSSSSSASPSSSTSSAKIRVQILPRARLWPVCVTDRVISMKIASDATTKTFRVICGIQSSNSPLQTFLLAREIVQPLLEEEQQNQSNKKKSSSSSSSSLCCWREGEVNEIKILEQESSASSSSGNNDELLKHYHRHHDIVDIKISSSPSSSCRQQLHLNQKQEENHVNEIALLSQLDLVLTQRVVTGEDGEIKRFTITSGCTLSYSSSTTATTTTTSASSSPASSSCPKSLLLLHPGKISVTVGTRSHFPQPNFLETIFSSEICSYDELFVQESSKQKQSSSSSSSLAVSFGLISTVELNPQSGNLQIACFEKSSGKQISTVPVPSSTSSSSSSCSSSTTTSFPLLPIKISTALSPDKRRCAKLFVFEDYSMVLVFISLKMAPSSSSVYVENTSWQFPSSPLLLKKQQQMSSFSASQQETMIFPSLFLSSSPNNNNNNNVQVYFLASSRSAFVHYQKQEEQESTKRVLVHCATVSSSSSSSLSSLLDDETLEEMKKETLYAHIDVSSSSSSSFLSKTTSLLRVSALEEEKKQQETNIDNDSFIAIFPTKLQIQSIPFVSHLKFDYALRCHSIFLGVSLVQLVKKRSSSSSSGFNAAEEDEDYEDDDRIRPATNVLSSIKLLSSSGSTSSGGGDESTSGSILQIDQVHLLSTKTSSSSSSSSLQNDSNNNEEQEQEAAAALFAVECSYSLNLPNNNNKQPPKGKTCLVFLIAAIIHPGYGAQLIPLQRFEFFSASECFVRPSSSSLYSSSSSSSTKKTTTSSIALKFLEATSDGSVLLRQLCCIEKDSEKLQPFSVHKKTQEKEQQAPILSGLLEPLVAVTFAQEKLRGGFDLLLSNGRSVEI